MRTAWTPRNIYLYVVCLVTLIMMISGTVSAIRSATELIYPQPRPYSGAIVAPDDKELSAEAQAKLQEEQRQIDAQWSRRNAVISIIGSAALLLIAAPLYRYHWRQVQQEREAADTSNKAS